MDYFWSPNKAYGKEKKRKKGGRGGGGGGGKQIQGMDSCIHDFGMIFVQEFLGYDC